MTLYMKVTLDKYEYPVAVAESVVELAKMVNVSTNTISSAMSHAKARGNRCQYVRVEVEDNE